MSEPMFEVAGMRVQKQGESLMTVWLKGYVSEFIKFFIPSPPQAGRHW